jgi:hypothetical protein
MQTSAAPIESSGAWRVRAATRRASLDLYRLAAFRWMTPCFAVRSTSASVSRIKPETVAASPEAIALRTFLTWLRSLLACERLRRRRLMSWRFFFSADACDAIWINLPEADGF